MLPNTERLNAFTRCQEQDCGQARRQAREQAREHAINRSGTGRLGTRFVF
jgi:hypothetical protein